MVSYLIENTLVHRKLVHRHDVNFNDAYEQDSLWGQLYSNDRQNSFRISSNHVCVIDEHQFPPLKNESLWINHVGSPWEKDRNMIFYSYLKDLKISNQLYTDAINYISQHLTIHGKSTEIACT